MRALYNSAGEPVDFSPALDHGIDMLAPDKEVCEPPRDGANCPRQDTCDNYEEPEEDEEEEQDEEDNDSEDDEDEDNRKRTKKRTNPNRMKTAKIWTKTIPS